MSRNYFLTGWFSLDGVTINSKCSFVSGVVQVILTSSIEN